MLGAATPSRQHYFGASAGFVGHKGIHLSKLGHPPAVAGGQFTGLFAVALGPRHRFFASLLCFPRSSVVELAACCASQRVPFWEACPSVSHLVDLASQQPNPLFAAHRWVAPLHGKPESAGWTGWRLRHMPRYLMQSATASIPATADRTTPPAECARPYDAITPVAVSAANISTANTGLSPR